MKPILDKSADITSLYLNYPTTYDTDHYNAPYLFFTTQSSEKNLLFDIEKERFLKVNNESCFAKTPKDFYNKTIDPFRRGPYKSLLYSVISSSHLKVSQSSANAGCLTKEGVIDVYINGDSAFCDIKIIGQKDCH